MTPAANVCEFPLENFRISISLNSSHQQLIKSLFRRLKSISRPSKYDAGIARVSMQAVTARYSFLRPQKPLLENPRFR